MILSSPVSRFHSVPRLAVSIIVALLTATAVGCGSKGVGGIVSGAQFTTAEENGDLYGNLSVLLNTGNVLLPSFEIPILNPKNPGAVYGVISMRDALSLGTELGVRVNLSEISGLEGIDGSLLPNGRAIPVVLGQGVRPIAVKIRGNSRVYLAFAEGTAMIGTAITIPEFDKISSVVGAIDVFFPFQGENGVRGAAGLFSSTQAGQSGLAVFVDVGSVLKDVSDKSLGRELAMMTAKSRSSSGVQFRSQQSLSRMQAYRLNRFLNELGDRDQRLRIQ